MEGSADPRTLDPEQVQEQLGTTAAASRLGGISISTLVTRWKAGDLTRLANGKWPWPLIRDEYVRFREGVRTGPEPGGWKQDGPPPGSVEGPTVAEPPETEAPNPVVADAPAEAAPPPSTSARDERAALETERLRLQVAKLKSDYDRRIPRPPEGDLPPLLPEIGEDPLDRKRRLEADRLELLVAKLRGELVASADVVRLVAEPLARVDAVCRMVPMRFAPELARRAQVDQVTAMQILDGVVAELRAALKSVGYYTPGDPVPGLPNDGLPELPERVG